MNGELALAFDIWSRFASFRRHYTTTSASSHPFIPRSAVEGVIGAIIGYKSEEYPDHLLKSRIAVELRKSDAQAQRLSKLAFQVSYTHSDFWRQVSKYLKKGGGSLNHVPVPRTMELIVNPKYRIYFATEDHEIYMRLLNNLKGHKTHYTPYLGSSNMIANFEFVGEYEVFDYSTTSDYVEIASIIPFFGRMPQVFVEPKFHYAVEYNIPLHVNREREPSGYYSALYSPEPGQPINARGVAFSTLKKGGDKLNVVFIPPTPG